MGAGGSRGGGGGLVVCATDYDALTGCSKYQSNN